MFTTSWLLVSCKFFLSTSLCGLFSVFCFFIDSTWPKGLLPALSDAKCNLCVCRHAYTHTCTCSHMQWPFSESVLQRLCNVPPACVYACVFCPLQMYVLWLILVIHPHIPKPIQCLALLSLPPSLPLSVSLSISRSFALVSTSDSLWHFSHNPPVPGS